MVVLTKPYILDNLVSSNWLRSHQIWSSHVCSRRVQNTARGIWGDAPQKQFWNLEATKFLLRPFFAQYDAIWSPDDSSTCMNIYPFHPLHHIAVAHHQPCVSVCWAIALSKTREWGKKWSGWNWTNWTDSYDPVHVYCSMACCSNVCNYD